MLLGLNQENPEDVLVLNALGRLAIKTGQFDRARVRFEEALETDPVNATAICLLAQVYEALGEDEKANAFSNKCANL